MIILTLMALSALLIGRAKEGAGTAADGRGEVLLVVKMIKPRAIEPVKKTQNVSRRRKRRRKIQKMT